MNPDYIATLNELPQHHRGLLLEQLHLAAVIPTFAMRGLGLTLPLPGADKVPTQRQVFDHLCRMANNALSNYLEVRAMAPAGHRADEVWGEDDDEIFTVEVTALAKDESEGYTLSVELNLLNLQCR